MTSELIGEGNNPVVELLVGIRMLLVFKSNKIGSGLDLLRKEGG
jgi:hypothetical protein